jgi:hypothetical protein
MKTEGIDLVGIGKLAKAIPPQVYERTTETACITFLKLVSPITEMTAGLGNYIKQKFDNMVSVEQALVTYSIEEAVTKAKNKGKPLQTPSHPKSFILALEHASKETDEHLHSLWVNLLTSQITGDLCHPHITETLSHLSPDEARILLTLIALDKIGSTNTYFGYVNFQYWALHNDDRNFNEWSYPCSLLVELGLAQTMAFENNFANPDIPQGAAILCLTKSGEQFLNAVS